MTLLPAIRRPGEEYASPDDLLACSDRAEADVRVPLWTKGGDAMLLRVIAPSQADEEAAHLAARAALLAAHKRAGLPPPEPDDEDWGTLVVETLRRCVLSPRMSQPQAAMLREKNPIALELLYAFIIGLRGFTPDGLADIVARLADLPPSGAPGEAAPDAIGADAGAVGPGAGD